MIEPVLIQKGVDMADDKQERQPAPPYIAYKTFKNFLASLKIAIPSRIDRSVMTSYAGGVQAQITHVLRYFNLIDKDGHPTDKLAPLVHSEGAEHQKILREMAHAGYPMLFKPPFDLEKATTAQLAEQFSKMATGETLRKCITFLLPLLKEAGINVSPHIKGAPKRNGNSKPRKAKAPAPAADTGAGVTPPAPPPAAPPVMGWSELLLSKFPSFDPSWPDDVKARWFDSFEKLMQSGQAGTGSSTT